MKRLPARAWGWIVWLFEKADIIPPLVIVSAYHYGGALVDYDLLPVAIVLGVLIDLGHYRSVKAAIKTPEIPQFAVMTVLTVMTGYYHWLWYRNFILAATVPALIICLSLLSKWGGWERQAITLSVPRVHPDDPQPTLSNSGYNPGRAEGCPECGRVCKSIQAQLSHNRSCARKARKDGGK